MVSALVILQTSTSFVQSLHEPSNQNHQQAQKSSKKSLFPPGKGPEACKNTCPASQMPNTDGKMPPLCSTWVEADSVPLTLQGSVSRAEWEANRSVPGGHRRCF